MIIFNISHKSSIRLNIVRDGESIETKLMRMVENNEPIRDNFGGNMIYMERGDGIDADCNPRTDKHLIAIDAAGHIGKSKIAKRYGDTKAGVVENSATDAGDNAA